MGLGQIMPSPKTGMAKAALAVPLHLALVLLTLHTSVYKTCSTMDIITVYCMFYSLYTITFITSNHAQQSYQNWWAWKFAVFTSTVVPFTVTPVFTLHTPSQEESKILFCHIHTHTHTMMMETVQRAYVNQVKLCSLWFISFSLYTKTSFEYRMFWSVDLPQLFQNRWGRFMDRNILYSSEVFCMLQEANEQQRTWLNVAISI